MKIRHSGDWLPKAVQEIVSNPISLYESSVV